MAKRNPNKQSETEVETGTVENPEAPEAPEVALTDTDIGQSFEAAVTAEKSEDEVKMAMIAAGSTFKVVTRQYNQLMVDTGRAISKAEKDELVSNAAGDNEIDTEEGFGDAVDFVVGSNDTITEKQAAASIRAFAKKNEIECWKKPKGSGGGANGFASKYYDFLKSNPDVTKEQAIAYVKGEGDHPDTSDNVKKHESHYVAIFNLVNDIRQAA